MTGKMAEIKENQKTKSTAVVENGVIIELYNEYAPAPTGVAGTEAARAEAAWLAEHPQGYILEINEYNWILWNFDIGKSDLKDEHIHALQNIIAPKFRDILALDGNALMHVRGHASSTGPDRVNADISRDRAWAGGRWLTLVEGFDENNVIARYFGEMIPWKPQVFELNVGKLLAQDRRVEFSLGFVIPREPRPPDEPVVEQPPEQFKEGTYTSGFTIVIQKKIQGPISVIGQFRHRSEAEVVAVLTTVEPGDSLNFVMKFENGSLKFDKVEAEIGQAVGIDGLSASASASGEYGVQYKGQFFSFENAEHSGTLAYDPEFDPTGPTFKYEIAVTPYKNMALEMDDGTKVTVSMSIKYILCIGLSETLKGRVLSAARNALAGIGSGSVAVGVASVVGGVLGTVGLLYVASALVAEAKEEATARAARAQEIDGFALRLAAQAMEDNEEYNRAVSQLEQIYSRSPDAYAAAYGGWQIGQALLDADPNREPDMRAAYGATLESVRSKINLVVGAMNNWAENSIPGTLEETLQKAALLESG